MLGLQLYWTLFLSRHLNSASSHPSHIQIRISFSMARDSQEEIIGIWSSWSILLHIYPVLSQRWSYWCRQILSHAKSSHDVSWNSNAKINENTNQIKESVTHYLQSPVWSNTMTIKSTYLLYNTLSSILWLRILLGVIAALLFSPHPSPNNVYPHLELQTRWTQTLAIVEILHAATGLSHFHSPAMPKLTRTQDSPAPPSSQLSPRPSRAASRSGP